MYVVLELWEIFGNFVSRQRDKIKRYTQSSGPESSRAVKDAMTQMGGRPHVVEILFHQLQRPSVSARLGGNDGSGYTISR